MSDPSLKPPPVRLPALRAGDLDVRGLDLSNELADLSTTIASIDEVTVSRRDGEPLDVGDLEITPAGSPAPYTNGADTTAYWWCTSADDLVERDYEILLVVTTAAGQILYRDMYQLVTPRMG